MASGEKPQSKFTEVQGIKLHYLEWGETGKPDLLLVHGWTSFASSWSTVAEYFRGRFHIVAPDLRGHGDPTNRKPVIACAILPKMFASSSKTWSCANPLMSAILGAVTSARSWHRIRRIFISRAFLEDPVFWRMLHAFMTALPVRWRGE
jgi:Lysophospholipase